MITIDSDPILNPVYIGSEILNEISLNDFKDIEIEHLYEKINMKFDVSYGFFSTALDWLYVIGAIDLSSRGNIEYAVK